MWTRTQHLHGSYTDERPILSAFDAMCDQRGLLGKASDVRDYNIPAMDGFEALNCFARQAGFVGIVWEQGKETRFISPAIKGRMSATMALNKLLAPSVFSLEVPEDPNPHTIYITLRNQVPTDASTQTE